MMTSRSSRWRDACLEQMGSLSRRPLMAFFMVLSHSRQNFLPF